MADATETVTAVGSRVRRGLRLFTSTQDQQWPRRATDVILLAISFVGIVFVGLAAIPEPGFSRAITRFLGALPEALTGMWQVSADSRTVWALVVLVAAFTRSRAKVGRDMILAILVSAALWLLLGRG